MKGPQSSSIFKAALDCLISLARNRCDVAGFHVPMLWASALRALPAVAQSRDTLRLIHFAERRPGPRSSGAAIRCARTLRDDSRSAGVRFVNRQPGPERGCCSTRSSPLIASARTQINGYRTEEFTHAAVAATIAERHGRRRLRYRGRRCRGMDSTSCRSSTERYFLAMRAATLARRGLQRLARSTFEPMVPRCGRKLPGYVLPPT